MKILVYGIKYDTDPKHYTESETKSPEEVKVMLNEMADQLPTVMDFDVNTTNKTEEDVLDELNVLMAEETELPIKSYAYRIV